MFIKNSLIVTASVLAAGLSVGAQAATYNATEDTYHYEFLGNQGSPVGDSGRILVWNHESNHGAKGLVKFESGAVAEAATAGMGNYTATLNLYAVCEPSGFVGACAGDAGAPSVVTDIVMQGSSWSEGDAGLAWGDVSESSTPFATLNQTSSMDGWVSIDVTALVDEWVGGAMDYGFSLSQENYGVLRADNGSVAVSQFCDTESSAGACAAGSFAPTLDITVSAVPVPAAAWLFGSGLLGLVGVARKKRNMLAS